MDAKKKENFLINLTAGGISGIVAKTIGAPIERVKLLIQTQAINRNLANNYKNPIDCVIRLYRLYFYYFLLQALRFL